MRVVPGMEGIKGSLEGDGGWGGGVNLGPLDVSVWTICRICGGVECPCTSNTLSQNIKLLGGRDPVVLIWRLMFVENTTSFSKNTPN